VYSAPSLHDIAISDDACRSMVFAGSSPITSTSPSSKAHQKSGPFAPPALLGISAPTTLSDSRCDRRLLRRRGRYPRHQRVSPDYPHHHSNVPCPLPRWTEMGAHVGCFPIRLGLPQTAIGSASTSSLSRPAQASRVLRPAGSLSRPTAAFVTRLRHGRLPDQAARQLPDQPTILWVEPPSTGVTRLRGALLWIKNFASGCQQFCFKASVERARSIQAIRGNDSIHAPTACRRLFQQHRP
jgi:hypothetical protein